MDFIVGLQWSNCTEGMHMPYLWDPCLLVPPKAFSDWMRWSLCPPGPLYCPVREHIALTKKNLKVFSEWRLCRMNDPRLWLLCSRAAVWHRIYWAFEAICSQYTQCPTYLFHIVDSLGTDRRVFRAEHFLDLCSAEEIGQRMFLVRFTSRGTYY